MMPCHATDAHAPLYGGKFVKSDEHARICVGLCILARREVTAFMRAGTNAKRYAALIGRRFSLHGLASWASRLYYAGAIFQIGDRELEMPAVADDSRVTVPWRDEVHDGLFEEQRHV